MNWGGVTEKLRISQILGCAHRGHGPAQALIAMIGVAALGRLLWLGDMEFKSDEPPCGSGADERIRDVPVFVPGL